MSLKPVLGIPPTTYVPVTYAVVLLLVLFLLLVLPGLRNNGSHVTFETIPDGVSVRVDGVRRGATPLTVFVERGTRSVTLLHPHFAREELRIEVPGRVLASALLPRRMTVQESLTLEDPRALAADAARRFNQWALVGEANAQYQFPMVLSDAVIALTSPARSSQAESANGAASAKEAADRLLEHALRDVHTPTLLKDYIRASALAEGAGNAMTGLQAAGLLRRVAELVDREPRLAYLIASALPENETSKFEASSWYEETTQGLVTEMLTETTEGGPADVETRTIRVAGRRFVEIPSSRFVMGIRSGSGAGDDAGLEQPHAANVGRFFIMDTEVTHSLFRQFVEARPQWSPSSRDELVQAGLATEDYLLDWRDDGGIDQSSRPVRYVSFHAAVAFCDWLDEQLPASLAGFEVRLPTSAEWEWAATLNASEGYDAVFADAAMSTPLPAGSSEPGMLGVYDLLGNVWEWTLDWYHPADYLVSSAPLFAGSQKVVRGGSWANDRRSIDVTTRGAQPPDWSTPFLGFRPVIAEAQP